MTRYYLVLMSIGKEKETECMRCISSIHLGGLITDIKNSISSCMSRLLLLLSYASFHWSLKVLVRTVW